MPKRVALCFYPDGLETEPAVVKALQDAARRLGEAGWRVDTLDAIPPLKEAADLQIRMWLADGYDAMVEAARKEGDRGALVALAGQRERAAGMDLARYSALLTRRATLTRQWELFFAEYPVLLLPVSAELLSRTSSIWPATKPMRASGARRCRRSACRSWACRPCPWPWAAYRARRGRSRWACSSAGRYREDLCLAAGEVIEAAGQPIDIAEPEA